MKAGVAIVDITPGQGEELGGYPHYPRNNTGVHDPLYAACLYLNSGGVEAALVTLDLLFCSKIHIREIRRRVEAASTIPGRNVMISCIHTHSGPWASGRLDIEGLESGVKQPEEYVASLIEKVSGAVLQARQNAFEASFGAASVLCGAEEGIGGNRCVPGGPHDPLVSVLAVRDRERTVRGVFVNYTLHPTFLHEDNTLCSADYVGYLRSQLGELAKDAVVCFGQGASGNQSSRYYRQGESFGEAERVGRTLGKAAFRALEKMEWKDDLDIRIAGREIPLELRSFGTEEALEKEVARCEEVFRDLSIKYRNSADRNEYYLWQNANLKLLGAEDQLGYVRMLNQGVKIELLEDERPVELQVIRLGDVCVVGSPGEVFVEYALYIKAMARCSMVVFNELANGCLPGYLYTPASLVSGGYETDTSMLSEVFGRHVVDHILNLLDEVVPVKAEGGCR